jgi:hypothetical protein
MMSRTAFHLDRHPIIPECGAVNPLTGESSALLAPTVNAAYMNHPLRFICGCAGLDVQVVPVLDRAGWGRRSEVRGSGAFGLKPI